LFRSEIIDKFIMQAERIVTYRPAFIEYELRARAHKKEWDFMSYNNDFKIELSDLKENLREGDLLVLGNPNNPTGLRIEEEKLRAIYSIVVEKKGFLLLDEAFYEFAPIDYDSIEIFRDEGYKRLVIIRAATKFFSLPGIRLGYACTEKSNVEKLGKIELPWSINSLADLAGQFIFQDKTYVDKSRTYIEREREYIYKNLEKIDGLEPYKTDSNFMLIRLNSWTEEEVFKFLLEKGILIRKCSTFPGLKGNYVRIAIKDRMNNERLITVFNQLK
ncbi:MAG: aminotransferase class I/II-fold pyridoxal phosphate-dependent enzyme, partial [Gudongella sp.]|nr:aminotransferase class I/II-fold pyridoxal phosphate-dependent enzyme [Gudongella sp.]